jgi:hypothetical protein
MKEKRQKNLHSLFKLLNDGGISKSWKPGRAWLKNTLRRWATDKNESQIVRVNARQALYELSEKEPSFVKDLNPVFLELEREDIPSIKARIKIVRKKFLPGIALSFISQNSSSRKFLFPNIKTEAEFFFLQ